MGARLPERSIGRDQTFTPRIIARSRVGNRRDISFVNAPRLCHGRRGPRAIELSTTDFDHAAAKRHDHRIAKNLCGQSRPEPVAFGIKKKTRDAFEEICWDDLRRQRIWPRRGLSNATRRKIRSPNWRYYRVFSIADGVLFGGTACA